jgi:hypothetical protein
VDRQLGRVRPGNEVRRTDQVEEATAIEPAAPADDLVLDEGDVRRGPTERGAPEAQEKARQLAEPARARVRAFRRRRSR